MKKITLPKAWVIILGSLLACWVADIIHPGFSGIAAMILLIIPVLIVDYLYPPKLIQTDIEQLLAVENTNPVVSGEYVEESEDDIE